MSKQCRDVLDVFPETVVLAFDVLEWTEPTSAKRITQSKAIVDAINKELASQGKQLAAKHFAGETVTQEDAVKMLAGSGGKFLENRKRLLTQRLKCAYNESPLGVWLDRHAWVLYIVVPVVVGSAGTWMYVARIGDTPASWAMPMANVKKTWKVQHLGKITLGTEDVKFVPSKREIAAKAFGKLDWERLSVKLTLGGGMADDSFVGASVKTGLTLAVSRGLEGLAAWELTGIGTDPKGSSSVKLNFHGGGASANLMLSLGGMLAYDQDGVFSAGGSASAALNGKLGDVPASVRLTGDSKFNLRPDMPPDEHKLMINILVGF